MLTVNPAGAQSPHFPLPGTAEEQAALGYLHANCGHCHNSESSLIPSGQALELRCGLETIHLDTVDECSPTSTTVDVPGGSCSRRTRIVRRTTAPRSRTARARPTTTTACIVAPGDPMDSQLFFRFTSLDFGNAHMPQTCVKTTDRYRILQTWITHFPH